MSLHHYRRSLARPRAMAPPLVAASLIALCVPMSLLITTAADAATVPLLGTTSSFGVLAGAGITNTGPTTVNGDIGTYPTTTISGTGSMTLNGANHAGDAVTQQAKSDLVVAYSGAAGQGPSSPIDADLGGQTLTAGVYNSASSVGLTGALTLNAQGDPNAVFVIQAGSTLTTASGSSVVLANGAQSCNVFWQVGSSATLGTGSTFRGTVLALQSITVTTNVTVDGRVLARNAAVTLDADVITVPTCTTTTSTTTTTTTITSTTTASTGVAATTVASAGTTTTTVPASAAAKLAAAKKAAAAAAKKRAAAVKKATTTTTTPKPASFAKPPIHHPGFTG